MLIFSATLLALALVLFLVMKLKPSDVEEDERKLQRELTPQTEQAYRAVPSDAVLILDFEKQERIAQVLQDTTNYAYGLIDTTSALVRMQKVLSGWGFFSCHTLFSLHYSAINEVSLLQIVDCSESEVENVTPLLASEAVSSKEYNSYKIYTLKSGLKISSAAGLLLASSSAICVESALRHIVGGTSILNNQEFYSTLKGVGGNDCLYINHKQIGKLFSGSVTYPFLKYSDFIMRLTNWSALHINPRQRNFISFEGYLSGNTDFINFASVLETSSGTPSLAHHILPASTMFAVSVNLSSIKGYVKDYEKYLDANKKLASYKARQENVQLPEAPSPMEWLSSEGFTEVVSAFCLIGGKYEWITLLYKNSTSLLGKITGIKGKGEWQKPAPFIYKGYISSVLGEIFSHNSEEQFCKTADWTIIGSARAVDEMFKGRANAVKLEKYLSSTPVSSFFEEKSNAKVIVNLKEGADTLFSVFNSFYRKRFVSSVSKKNFEYATANIISKGGRTWANLTFYAATLSSPPAMFDMEDGEVVYIDSTFKTFYGPFALVDLEKGDTTWFEQSRRYLSISYMDRNKKGLWGIPMKDTIKSYAGMVAMADGKPYITFILGNKLYMMSRRGAHATGYPKTLDIGVSIGPKVIIENGRYLLLILTEENIITKRKLNGELAEDWTDIHSPEFTRELPEEITLFGKHYYILRTISKLRIYTQEGEEITVKNLKRPISRESTVTEEKDGFVRVMGTDGKEFLLNLKSGRIKKL